MEMKEDGEAGGKRGMRGVTGDSSSGRDKKVKIR